MSVILVSPFANGDIRDWQPGRFSALIGLLLDRWDGMIQVIGTRSQATRAAAIIRPYAATRVVSLCGHLASDEVADAVRDAACVIGNNSGMTHLAGWLGVPTVCVFGGSHQRIEWRPTGFSTRTLSRAIGCAPCHLHYARDCPYDKACLALIEPKAVADAAFAAMAGTWDEEAHHGV